VVGQLSLEAVFFLLGLLLEEDRLGGLLFCFLGCQCCSGFFALGSTLARLVSRSFRSLL